MRKTFLFSMQDHKHDERLAEVSCARSLSLQDDVLKVVLFCDVIHPAQFSELMLLILIYLYSFAAVQPDSISSSNLEAWEMDDSTEDQRLPHRYLPFNAMRKLIPFKAGLLR